MKIGIDLGTTYSAAAYMKDGKPVVIMNSEGDATTPSVVLFEESGDVTVGKAAKERVLIEEENTVSTVKDYMGTEHIYTVREQNYRPEDISSLILKKIVKYSEESLGEPVEGAVVTIPAYFNDAQRQATEDACELAGINLINMINEPTAAAICYAKDKELSEGANVMVYDLGGGTFDVSVVSITAEGIKVVSTAGLRKTGGHFFDQMLEDYIIDLFYEKHEIDLTEEDYIDERQDLSTRTEQCKIQLSVKKQTDIMIRVGKIKERFTITREQFEDLIKNFYQRTQLCMDKALNDAEMKWSDISKILLVGGSSRIPYIREQIRLHTGIEASADIDPDKAVCYGAAIFANSEENGYQVRDVCSHSIGVLVIDAEGNSINQIVIPRNSSLPAVKSHNFLLPFDNITDLEMEFTEGEFTNVDYVNVFSKVDISIKSGIPANTPVEIKMSLDANQLLNVSICIKSKPEINEELVIDRKSNLTIREKQRRKTKLALTNIL